MKLLLKILGEPHNGTHKTVTFGKGYTFLWNDALRAYAYEPKSPRETEEIYQSQAVQKVWTFIPHVIETPAPVTVSTELLAKLQQQVATDAETIAMLRADLAAQQEKATKGAKPAKAKAAHPVTTDNDLPDV